MASVRMGSVAKVFSVVGLLHLKRNYPFDKIPEKNDPAIHDTELS